jgi:hypothetical protein
MGASLGDNCMRVSVGHVFNIAGLFAAKVDLIAMGLKDVTGAMAAIATRIISPFENILLVELRQVL